jgi:hypothetical protein
MPQRFLQTCGVPATETTQWPGPERLSRPGLSAPAVEVLRRIGPGLGLSEWPSGSRERLVAVLAKTHPGPGVRLTPAARRALDDHGWIHTGIDRSPAAFGPGWPEWRDAPAAKVARPEPPTAEDVEATLTALRRAGFGGRRPIIVGARRLVQRLRR